MMHAVTTTKAPQAVGPYSQAVSVCPGNCQLLFVSGQLPLDPQTGKLVEGGIEVSTQRVLKNIEAILHADGSDFNQILRVEIFLKDLSDFQKVNAEYQKWFTQGHFPARQTIQVAKLPLDASIEISCIALSRPSPERSDHEK